MRIPPKWIGNWPVLLAITLTSILTMAGCGGSSSSSSGSNLTATPTFNPGAGTYNKSQTVTISDATPGAVLYCTADGTTPTTSSLACSQPTTVYQTEFLQAIAVAPGKPPSAVASAGYTIDLNAAATPTFSPAGGTYLGTQNVTISTATTGANIYYTVDGTVPTASSTLYTGPVAISKTSTLSAIAVASGYNNSGVASATYTISTAAPAITGISPDAVPTGSTGFTLTVNGTNFVQGSTVLWSSSTAGGMNAVVRAAAQSSGTPLATNFVSPTQLTAAVPANLVATAGAVSVAVENPDGSSSGSAPSNSTFAVGAPTLGTISPTSITTGSAGFTLTVNGTNFASGATAQWGNTALTTSLVSASQLAATVPANLISTAGTATVTVTDAAGTTSGATFTINAVMQAATAPTFSLAGNTLTIIDATPGAAIYYTVNGAAPTVTPSELYSAPITVAQSDKIQAMAVASGYTNSTVATYTVSPAAAQPTFSLSANKLTILDATAGASIYYTVNGAAPTVTPSELYGAPFTVAQGDKIQAIAIATNYSTSSTGSYTVSFSPAAQPTFTISSNQLTILDATSGAAIYYTVNGAVPTVTPSELYSAPFTVAQGDNVQAIAVAAGYTSSGVASYTFSSTLPEPTFSVSGNQLTILDTNTGASIYYTVNGGVPTATPSELYSAPITVSVGDKVQAMAALTGYTNSNVATYTVTAAVTMPTFSVPGGSYTTAQTVTISDSTTGATIYYAVGATPTATPADLYTPGTPIAVSQTETINAIAVATGYSDSELATATYTLTIGNTNLSGSVFTGAPGTAGAVAVSGAQVQVYAAGSEGYGSAAAPLLPSGATVTTDASGAFSLTYNCPAAPPGDLVYVVATGGAVGTTGGGSTLSFMTAIGSCNSTTPITQVTVNEATTVASVYALQQFMAPDGNVGAAGNGISYQGLSNAFKTVNNLVNLSSGAVREYTPDYTQSLAEDHNILNNSTVPRARINTLANALNACASNGNGCSDLFSAATVGTTPNNTLDAILNIAQNPGNKPGDVYTVASGSTIFTPTLSGAPNDWTLAVTFTGGGLGFAPGIAVNGQTGFQLLHTALAIDADDNIWVSAYSNRVADHGNQTDSDSVDRASGMIAKFNNQGKAFTSASSTSALGGYIPIATQGSDGYHNAGTQASHAIAIDPSGNAWVLGGGIYIGNGQTGTPGGGALSEVGADLTSLKIPYIAMNLISASSVAIDGSGNVWALGDVLYEFNNDGSQKLSNSGLEGANGFGYFETQSLIFDSQQSALSASDPFTLTLYQIDPSTGNNTVDYNPNLDGFGYTPLAADSMGNVYGCEEDNGQELDVFNVGVTSIPTPNHPSIPTTRGCGNQMVMDGLAHIFTVTGNTNSQPGIIDEFTVGASGITPISPTSTGYTGTSSNESPVINPDPQGPALPFPGTTNAASTNSVMGAALDGSGNLWVLNEDTGTTASPGNVLVEFIGIGAPVVTPTSLALQFNQVGVRP